MRILKERVIQVSISEQLTDLQQSARHLSVSFQREKPVKCSMLKCSKQLCLRCVSIDETAGTRKITKNVIRHLDKMNADCNMTARLEARLSLAVGARVMLRRNIDTKAGLVNGAIGTVLSIAAPHVTVQFDHVSVPYKVKSRFMVMKNFYVYRKQYPLIVAYVVTIYKCQGLSFKL